MPPPNAKITLGTIATEAKVSRMTVSLALRNSPEISRTTTRRIRALAQRLGYTPDPELSNLMAKLRSSSHGRAPVTIALITNEDEGTTWRNFFTHVGYFEGAQTQAKAQGYGVEEFRLYSDGMSEARLSQVLAARGIEGAIILPFINRAPTLGLDFEWARFSIVTCGYSLQQPALHRSCAAHMRGVMEVCRQLHALGYRRLGLALDRDQDRRAGHNWTAGFLAANQILPDVRRIPIYCPEAQTERTFREWFRRHRPDAVVHIRREGDILPWIERCGARVPNDVGYAFLDLWPSMPHLSGLNQQADQVGAAAFDLVSTSIRHNERGLPAAPKIVLSEGRWAPGTTVRAQ